MAARKKAARKATTSAAKGRRKATVRKKPARKTAAKKKVTRKRAPPAPAAPAAENTFPEIEALAELMDRHGLFEVEYQVGPGGSRTIHVSRLGPQITTSAAPAQFAQPMAAEPAPVESAPGAPPAPAADEGLVPFKSPMVGTFYRAPSPEASSFVSVGDSIDPSAVVCIIEAMKVMNEISPDVSGEVVSIEVENGEAVEFGQTLMLVRPR